MKIRLIFNVLLHGYGEGQITQLGSDFHRIKTCQSLHLRASPSGSCMRLTK